MRRRRERDTIDLLADAGFVAFPIGRGQVIALHRDEPPRLIALDDRAARCLLLAARLTGAIPVAARWPRWRRSYGTVPDWTAL
jgi:hypothetical protein